MVRKFTLFILLFIGFNIAAKAQATTVTISLPFGSDTTCPGEQLVFHSGYTPSTLAVSYKWYHNGVYTGVALDSFVTTAPLDGDNVYVKIFFVNPTTGLLDSVTSNIIIVHRATPLVPRVLTSLIIGSNPDCPGHQLTFEALPIHGGTAPLYQWFINGVPQIGSDSLTFSRIFNGGDVVSVRMISNSICRTNDTAFSPGTTIVHDSMTAGISISVNRNPICSGRNDTLNATVVNAGLGWTIAWYVDSAFVPGAVGTMYITDSLHDNAHVYAILRSTDPCVVNDTTVSNVIIMTVVPLTNPTVTVNMIAGSNPGCLDSTVTFQATIAGFGTAPTSTWYVNGLPVASGTYTFTSTFADGDLLTLRVRTTDGNCYTNDSITTPAILMIRDTTPVAPLVSLIDNLLKANTAGTYQWYFNGSLIPGATGQIYHPTMLGYYYAIRTDGYCPSLPSNTIYISLLEVNEMAASETKIYPNPTTGSLTFDWGSRNVSATIEVLNIFGQQLMTEDVTRSSRHEMNLSHLPMGNYIVVLRDENGNTSTHKILLSK